MQVKFLEVVDKMIGHLLVGLHDAEQQQQQRYCVCVTGDHSTPVVFGDHSHEPVPFAAARVCDAVAAMGGQQQLDIRRQYVSSSSSSSGSDQAAAQQDGDAVGRIPLPNVKQPPQIQELLQQAAQQHNRRATATAAAARAAPAADGATSSGPMDSKALGSSSNSDLGPWPEGVPQRVLWDGVCAFDELSAAQGCLGRFTGAGVLPLLKQFCGWPHQH
jgi:hypothetical protein